MKQSRIPLTILAATFSGTAIHADTFRVEIDYMVTGSHTHRPSQLVLDAVIQMFACHGHTLIIDLDDQIAHHNVLRRDPDDCEASFFEYSDSSDSFGAIRDAFFDHQDSGNFWHYCLFAHQYEDDNCNTTGSSGLGQNPGQFFVVTLGGFSNQTGTPFDQAATLAHELGHNLSLTHCGTSNCDSDGDYVPVYASIMSYRYQLAGVRSNLLCNQLAPPDAKYKDLDYSSGRMCNLNESNMNEFRGTYMLPVDWDCDGTLESSVAQDIGGGGAGWCGSNGNLSVVGDENDWGDVQDPESSALASSRDVSCITADEWRQVEQEMLDAGGCTQPALQVESCLSGNNVFIGAFNEIVFGNCENPYSSPLAADNGIAAPPNSMFYVKPGVYEAAGAITLDKPGTWSCPTGTATFR